VTHAPRPPDTPGCPTSNVRRRPGGFQLTKRLFPETLSVVRVQPLFNHTATQAALPGFRVHAAATNGTDTAAVEEHAEHIHSYMVLLFLFFALTLGTAVADIARHRMHANMPFNNETSRLNSRSEGSCVSMTWRGSICQALSLGLGSRHLLSGLPIPYTGVLLLWGRAAAQVARTEPRRQHAF